MRAQVVSSNDKPPIPGQGVCFYVMPCHLLFGGKCEWLHEPRLFALKVKTWPSAHQLALWRDSSPQSWKRAVHLFTYPLPERPAKTLHISWVLRPISCCDQILSTKSSSSSLFFGLFFFLSVFGPPNGTIMFWVFFAVLVLTWIWFVFVVSEWNLCDGRLPIRAPCHMTVQIKFPLSPGFVPVPQKILEIFVAREASHILILSLSFLLASCKVHKPVAQWMLLLIDEQYVAMIHHTHPSNNNLWLMRRF